MLAPYDSDAPTWREDGVVFGNLIERNLGVSFRILNETTREGKALAMENNLPDAYLRTRPQIEQDLGSVLNDVCSEAMVQLTICEPEEIDTLYEQYVQTYLASGGSTWIEQATEIYKVQEGIE